MHTVELTCWFLELAMCAKLSVGINSVCNSSQVYDTQYQTKESLKEVCKGQSQHLLTGTASLSSHTCSWRNIGKSLAPF